MLLIKGSFHEGTSYKQHRLACMRHEVRACASGGTLEVSLDYLTGNTEDYLKDKSILKRINEIAALKENDKSYILFTLDAMLRDAKARHAY